MLNVLLLSLSVAGQAFLLNEEELQAWNNVKQMGVSVRDSQCSGEIGFAFEQASNVYSGTAFSTEFLESLAYIQGVAGDIPEAEAFRAQFQNLTANLANSYKNQVAQAQAAYTSSVLAAEREKERLEKEKAEKEAAYKQAAANDAALALARSGEMVNGKSNGTVSGPIAYGVINSAERISTILGSLLAMASLL